VSCLQDGHLFRSCTHKRLSMYWIGDWIEDWIADGLEIGMEIGLEIGLEIGIGDSITVGQNHTYGANTVFLAGMSLYTAIHGVHIQLWPTVDSMQMRLGVTVRNKRKVTIQSAGDKSDQSKRRR